MAGRVRCIRHIDAAPLLPRRSKHTTGSARQQGAICDMQAAASAQQPHMQSVICRARMHALKFLFRRRTCAPAPPASRPLPAGVCQRSTSVCKMSYKVPRACAHEPPPDLRSGSACQQASASACCMIYDMHVLSQAACKLLSNFTTPPALWLRLPAGLCQRPVLAGCEVGEGWPQPTHRHLVAQQRLGDAVVGVATWRGDAQ